MSPANYVRKGSYRRDNEDRRGQGVFAFAPGATISTQQAAKMIGVCDDTVRAMCESGELVYFKRRPDVPGSPLRIVKDSVYRHLAKITDTFALDGPHDPPIAQNTPTTQVRK